MRAAGRKLSFGLLAAAPLLGGVSGSRNLAVTLGEPDGPLGQKSNLFERCQTQPEQHIFGLLLLWAATDDDEHNVYAIAL